MSRRARGAVVGLSMLAVSLPTVLDPARAAGAGAVAQPDTVSRDVALDLASALPASGVDRLRGGAVRTTAELRSRPLEACPGVWFTATGVVWRQRGDGAVGGSVVWLGDGGETIGRAQLTSDDDGPDGAAPPAAGPGLRSTDLIWTGGARCARITFDLPAGVTISNPHVAFVNTSGSRAGPGTGPPDLRSRPSTGGADAADASDAGTSGGPPVPAMVSRASWGAEPRAFNTGSPGCSAPYYSPIKVAYVHHTSGSNSYSPRQSDDIVRAIDWYHTQERGYCDIAYSFLVDRWGTIFVGRAGGSDLPVTPGSQAGFNPYTFSVSVMGNFATATPPAAAIAGVERVLAWKLDVAHVPADGTATLVSQGFDTDRYPPGRRITMHTIEGHRRTSQTDCPGRIWDLLPRIRRTVAAMGGAKILRPAQSSLRVEPGAPVHLTATATDPLRWTVTIRRADGSAIRPMQLPGRTKSLRASWDGRDAHGDSVAPGKYLAVIGGATKGGRTPRPATLQVDVPGPPPGPLPVPSGTVKVGSGFSLLRAVAATAPADVWAVGSVATGAAVRPLVRHLDATGWHGVGVPNPGIHGSVFQAVDATATDDVWAGGFSCLSATCGPNGGFGSRTLLQHWNGRAWTAVRTPSPGTALNEIRAVDAVGSDDAWAVGLWSDRGRWLRHGLVLHWNGSTWRQVPVPFVGGEVHLDGVSAAGPDDAWVVGEACPGPCSGLAHSVAMILHWDGSKLVRVRPAPLGADRSGLDGVLAVGPEEAWAVGGRSANRVAPTHPLAERWDGSRWRLVNAPLAGKSAHWFGITRVPGAGLWSFGGFAPGSVERPLVMRRRTGGAWSRARVPSPDVHLAFVDDAAAISKTNVWAVGPSTAGPLALHWNGSSWSRVDAG